MRDKTFIAVVCSILLFFFSVSPFIYALSSAGVLDALNTKNLIVTEKVYGPDVFGHQVLNTAERARTLLRNVYINCIPFYDTAVSSVRFAEVSLLGLTGRLAEPFFSRPPEDAPPSPDTAPTGSGEDTLPETEPLPPPVEYLSVPVWGDGRPFIYAIEPLKVMERVEGASGDELQKLTEMQLAHIHRLKEAADGINYYVYMGTRLQETEMYDDMITGPDSTVRYYEYFRDHLDSDIRFDRFRMDTPDDRLNKKFRSDHHWNIYGAYEGYRQIISMMAEDSPEIGAPNEYEVIKIPGIKWIGSLGSAAGQTDMGYADDFYILDLTDLPDFSGNDYDLKGLQQSFTAGEFNKFGVSFDYYVAFNQPQDRYIFEGNHTGRNLLLLGDSYSWSISAILASHFDTTVCFIRPWTVANDVTYDYRQLIEDNGITDVLILLYSSRLLFGYDSTDFGRMLTG